MTGHQTKYERQKANTAKWFKRSNPDAWFRLNMGCSSEKTFKQILSII